MRPPSSKVSVSSVSRVRGVPLVDPTPVDLSDPVDPSEVPPRSNLPAAPVVSPEVSEVEPSRPPCSLSSVSE